LTHKQEVNSDDQVELAYQDRDVAFTDSSLKILLLNRPRLWLCRNWKTVMLDFEVKICTNHYKRELGW